MTKTGIHINGVQQVVKELNADLQKMKKSSLAGLIQFAIKVRRHMEDNSPKIPIDTGNLRASWFVVTAVSTPQGSSPNFKGKTKPELTSRHLYVTRAAQQLAKGTIIPTVIMGFTANYAEKVHDDYETVYKRPGSGAGFFYAALNSCKPDFKQTIEKAIRKYTF